MMKLGLVFCLVFFTVTAFASEKHLQWDEVPGAASYRVDLSTDSGETWVLGAAVVAAPETSATVTVPEDGLVLMRAVSINVGGQETVNYSTGVYYNASWELPKAVVGLGIGE